jgi:hypothetical protein
VSASGAAAGGVAAPAAAGEPLPSAAPTMAAGETAPAAAAGMKKIRSSGEDCVGSSSGSDINLLLVNAPDWGSPGGGGACAAPQVVDVAKPSDRQLQEECEWHEGGLLYHVQGGFGAALEGFCQTRVLVCTLHSAMPKMQLSKLLALHAVKWGAVLGTRRFGVAESAEATQRPAVGVFLVMFNVCENKKCSRQVQQWSQGDCRSGCRRVTGVGGHGGAIFLVILSLVRQGACTRGYWSSAAWQW